MKRDKATDCAVSRPIQTYPSGAREVAFPLGGIGTGNVSVGARGQLKDWEIFNWPAKNTKFPFAFYSIWANNAQMEAPVVKILESRLHPPHTSSHGYLQHELVNLPRMEDATLQCEQPFARVAFADGDLPVQVEMEAFTPFVPLHSGDSGIPGFVIRYKVKNLADVPTDVTVAGSLPNASGFEGYDVIENLQLADSVHNEYREEGGVRGLYYRPETLAETHVRYGNMALMTTAEQVTYKTEWFNGEWVDGIQDFWDDFCEDGRLAPVSESDTLGCEFAQFHNFSFLTRKEKIGSLGIYATLQPGEEKTFEFVTAWYFPNRVSAWIEFDEDIENCKAGKYPTVRNYYATCFTSAWQAGKYLLDELPRLEAYSRRFSEAIYRRSTLPPSVVDAVTANITNLKSQLCFRVEDGTFCGYEGIRDYVGCGYGSVPHVWNYAQTVAFLFPDLERSMRRVEFGRETDEEGCMSTRMFAVLGQERYAMVPACDGQLGSVVRLWRDYRISGDLDFLKELWPHVVRCMAFAKRHWDKDSDGILDGQQNTTYDIEFYGPNPMTEFIYLAALKACAEMAEAVGDEAHRQEYAGQYETARKKADTLLFDGEYYVQNAPAGTLETYRYQYGQGCLSDQLFGQFLAFVAGLGELLPSQHVQSALKAIYRYNFKQDFYHTDSVHRAYAVNDEKGLITCSWPKGGRPKFPLSYSGEVWTGIEYQVAATMLYEGLVEEGLAIVQAVRERYDGYKRNPFSEVESGHHYARAMASYALLPALSGADWNAPSGTLSFRPTYRPEDFSCFFSTGSAWGVYSQRKTEGGQMEGEIEVLYGSLAGVRVLSEFPVRITEQKP